MYIPVSLRKLKFSYNYDSKKCAYNRVKDIPTKLNLLGLLFTRLLKILWLIIISRLKNIKQYWLCLLYIYPNISTAIRSMISHPGIIWTQILFLIYINVIDREYRIRVWRFVVINLYKRIAPILKMTCQMLV